MEERQTIVVVLLVVAIILSSVSIVLNLNVLSPLKQTPTGDVVSPHANVGVTIYDNYTEEEKINGTR